MDELERLRQENARLDAEEEARKRLGEREREKSKLRRSIWVKKNPKVVKVVRVAKQSAGGVGMILSKVGRGVGRGVGQGVKNYAKNYEAEQKRRPQRRRVVRVKKVKKKSPKKKRVVRVRRRPRPQNNLNLPSYHNFF